MRKIKGITVLKTIVHLENWKKKLTQKISLLLIKLLSKPLLYRPKYEMRVVLAITYYQPKKVEINELFFILIKCVFICD